MIDKFLDAAYFDKLEREWLEEEWEECYLPDEEWEFGRLVRLDEFHGHDQRVTCRKCGFSWWW